MNQLGARASANKRLQAKCSIILLALVICSTLSLSKSLAKSPETTDTQISIRTTPEDLKYGEEQLRIMLHDRPIMKAFVRTGDPVWSWAQRQFAGEFTGRRYSWQNQPPQAGQNQVCFHSVNSGQDAGYIVVLEKRPNGESLDGEYLWASVIFELFNIRNDFAFDSIQGQAAAGTIDKNKYVIRCTKLEYATTKKVSDFFQDLWLPNAKKLGLETHPWYWFRNDPNTYEQWMHRQRAQGGYVSYYETLYDRLVRQTRERLDGQRGDFQVPSDSNGPS